MKMIVKIVIICAGILTGFSSWYFFNMKQNNPVEEISEDIVEDQLNELFGETDIALDFSPEPEKEKDESSKEGKS